MNATTADRPASTPRYVLAWPPSTRAKPAASTATAPHATATRVAEVRGSGPPCSGRGTWARPIATHAPNSRPKAWVSVPK